MARAPIYRDKGNKDMAREKGAHAKAEGESKKGGGGEEPAKAKKGLAEDKGSDSKEGGDKGLAEDKGADVGSRHAEERQAMAKRHESEHKDHDNNHREALRQMHGRQEKDHSAMNKRHMEEMAAMTEQGAGAEEGQQPMAQPGGQGAGGPVAAAA